MAAQSTKKQASKTKTSKTVFTFFAPEAAEVCLAGSFNEWREKELFLKKDKKGNWKISLPLQAGRYEYRFIVDGHWANSQEQVECVPNLYGTWNSVLKIEG